MIYVIDGIIVLGVLAVCAMLWMGFAFASKR